MKNASKVKVLFQSIISAAYRFKITTTYNILIVLIISFWIEGMIKSYIEDLPRVIITLLLSSLFAIVTQLLYESSIFKNFNKYISYILPILFSFVWYFLFRETSYDILAIKTFITSSSLILIIILLLTIKQDHLISLRIFQLTKNFIVSCVFGLILQAGIVIILGAIMALLFDFGYELYGHIFNILWCFIIPLYFLSIFPKREENIGVQLKEQENITKFTKLIVVNILIPLISIFALVLLLYIFKILITWDWPVGAVTPLVLTFSVIAIFVYSFVSVFKPSVVKLYEKGLPVVIIILSILNFVSQYIRISDYGLTKNRYYIIVLSIIVLLWGLIPLILKNKRKVYSVATTVIILIALLIPPFDGDLITFRSQSKRLKSILIENNMISGEKVIYNKNISKEARIEITSIVDYLKDNNQYDKLSYIDSSLSFEKQFGFPKTWKYGSYNDEDEKKEFIVKTDRNSAINIEGYDYYINVPWLYGEQINIGDESFKVTVNYSKKTITIENKKDKVTLTASEIKGNLINKDGIEDNEYNDDVSYEDASIDLKFTDYYIKITFNYLRLKENSMDMTFFLLIKKK